MKNILLSLMLLCSARGFAQKASFDIVTYTPPPGWKQETGNNYISYSRIDGGSWAQMAIYKSTSSKGDINSDSDSEWQAIVLAAHTMEKEEKTKPETADGWTVMSRSSVWQYNGANVATILTTYSNGQECISVLCNATARPYLTDYKKLISSLELKSSAPTSETPSGSDKPSDLVDTWGNYLSQTSGNFNTGGYFWEEYHFYADGTYKFLKKDFSTYTPEILLGYEAGTWSAKGNQLNIKAIKGKDEEWSKHNSGSVYEWGKLLKVSGRKLETAGYTFEVKYLPGMYKNHLILKSGKATERDGRQSNQDHAPQEFNDTTVSAGEAKIVPPPTSLSGL